MTTHEKTRLIELLCSGDEANILLAKEICEQQGRVDIIQEAFGFMQARVLANTFTFEAYRDNCKNPEIAARCIFGIKITFSAFPLLGLKSKKYHELESMIIVNNYYAQHLQSSE